MFFLEISRISSVQSVHVYEFNQDAISSGQSTPSHHWDHVSDICQHSPDHTSPSHSDKTCDNHQDENQETDAGGPDTKWVEALNINWLTYQQCIKVLSKYSNFIALLKSTSISFCNRGRLMLIVESAN